MLRRVNRRDDRDDLAGAGVDLHFKLAAAVDSIHRPDRRVILSFEDDQKDGAAADRSEGIGFGFPLLMKVQVLAVLEGWVMILRT